jgi:ferric-dicitrate binding protein FerR (iron transport regulator)
MNREKRLEELCTLYRENRATPEEARELLEYFATRPPEELDKLLRPIQATFTPNPAWEPPMAAADIVALTERRRIKQQTLRLRLRYASAACLLLLAGVAWFILREPAALTVTYQTDTHAKNYQLPDGTHINLLPHSSITYRQTIHQRFLSLTGTAWFDVAADAGKPFTIQTRHILTQILGTSLAIDASPDKDAVTISLHSGSVQVQDRQHVTRLLPNQQLAIALNNRTRPVVKPINVAQQLQWLGQDTLLSNAPYEQVAVFLAAKFGTGIAFEEEALRYETIHTELKATETLPQILDNLSRLTGSSYRLDKNNVYLSVKK